MKPSVIFMGSKPGSVIALETLLERGWKVHAVMVTPKYDFSWAGGPSLEEYALNQNLPVLENQKEIDARLDVDFVISYMYRKLVKKPLLDMPKRAALNFHAAPLPGFGGYAIYNIAILEDSPFYGCTCHYMDEGFDTGDLLKVVTFPIEPQKETAVSLERKTQREMIKLFVEFCELAESGKDLPREPQDKSKQRYMTLEELEKLKEISLDADYDHAQKIARAFWFPSYGCAFVTVKGRKVEVIPDIVKREVAVALHRDDFDLLREAAKKVTIKGPTS